MIRVACDCRMADWSGVGRYTTGLVRALAASPGIELVQIVRPGLTPPAPNAEAVTAKEGSPFTYAGARAVASAVRRIRPDVTHSLHFPTPLPAPAPLVVTLQDLTPLAVPEVMPSRFKRSVYRYWNRRACTVAHTIIVPSEHTASDVRRLFPGARAMTRVIPHAADDFSSGPVGAPPAAVRAGRYVLSMGNTRANKDLPTLLRAFARLAREDGDVRLVLAGAEVPGYVASILDGDPAASRVAFSGPVTDEELRAMFAGAAAFAFPSTYEGFGLPVLEAMALGAPVVVADATSLPEVAGPAALTFPAGDDAQLASRLATLLEDGEARTRLIAAGRERAAAFSWAATAAATVEVYEEAAR